MQIADPGVKYRGVMHVLRVGLVVALLLAIPPGASPARRATGLPPERHLVEQLIPGVQFSMDDQPDAAGMWRLTDDHHQTLGWVVRSFPEALDVVGYRGPTEAIVVLTSDYHIWEVGILSSSDTPEHVEAVKADARFFQQFQGREWSALGNQPSVDAVSGATLTSMALAEGVLARAGNEIPSLIFSEPVTAEELRAWFPAAQSVECQGGWCQVLAADGKLLGQVVRTGPLRDDIIGYQGPTEVLLQLSDDGRVISGKLRKSFDNEPYVDYVRVEDYFWKTLLGRTLGELAELDIKAAGIEGVSGATMTSLAVAKTVVQTAAPALAQLEARELAAASSRQWPWQSVRWTLIDGVTLALLVAALFLRRLRVFRHPAARRVWLLGVVLVIGLWGGNLISLSLIAGWSAEGIPWRLAPGLAAVATVALLVPSLSKANTYCSHICPHGALQQLVRTKRIPINQHPGVKIFSRWCARLPGTLLVLGYLSLLIMPTINLAAWEPFHAYLFRIAGWGAILFAVATIALSAIIPMAYCRLGCPTGRLLDYLRYRASSQKLMLSDLLAVLLLLIALWI